MRLEWITFQISALRLDPAFRMGLQSSIRFLESDLFARFVVALCTNSTRRPGTWCVGLRLDGFGALAGVEGKKFSLLHTPPHQPWGRHGLPCNGYWDYFQGIKRPGMALATHCLLGPKLNNRVVPVLHICAVNASYRETFTLLTIKTLSRPVVQSYVPENEF